jgi:phosphoribosylglycinamide formyltransferase-1
MLNIGVLLSGGGRTLDNFHMKIEAGSLNARIQVVISNVEDAGGLQKAKNYGYPAFWADKNEGINKILNDYDIDIICLAGYLKLYTPPDYLKKNVLNIHPSLIPLFCGEGFYGDIVHRAVKERGCMVSGCTVHFANERYDDGPIVLQKCVALDYDDSIKDIAAKVFEGECEAFPAAINLVDQKGIEFFWNRLA